MNAAHRLANQLYKRNITLYRALYGMFKSIQDRSEWQIIRRHVSAGDVVLDIGANIGFYTTRLSRLVGAAGRVHSFEPDATNFRHLSSAACMLPNVSLNNKAVGRESGQLKLYLSDSLNVDHRTYEPEMYDSVLTVDVTSIDDYLLGQDGHVDFIKMDIQGHEMEAVAGMSKMLEKNPKITMLSEFWPYGLRQSGGSAGAYFVLLQRHGFTLTLLSSGKSQPLTQETVARLESLGEERYFNVLAVRA